MKKYNNIQRMLNIISRAVFEFDFEVNERDEIIDAYAKACDVITDGTDGCDRIIVGELGNHNEHLFYDDKLGFTKEIDGEIVSCGRGSHWFRYDDETGEYKEIEHWYDVDTDNDYALCDVDLDSEGKVIYVIAQLV